MPPGASQDAPPRAWTLPERFQDGFAVLGAGIYDALAVHRCVFFLARSEVIRFRTLQCFMLNGVIFLGSILLFNWAVEPLIGLLQRFLLDSGDVDGAWALVASFSMFSALYKLLWIYPIYCISFILNMVMYQEVADSAFACLPQHKPSKVSPPALDRFITEIFRVLNNLVYIFEMNLMYYIPVVGPGLYFVHSCWLASIYCFEYCWVNRRWNSNRRLDHFEGHWLYYAGFGFPVSLLSFLCPKFIDAGVFALLFPLCILTATTAEPRPLRRAPALARLPIFVAVQGISCLVLRRFEGRMQAYRQ